MYTPDQVLKAETYLQEFTNNMNFQGTAESSAEGIYLTLTDRMSIKNEIETATKIVVHEKNTLLRRIETLEWVIARRMSLDWRRKDPRMFTLETRQNKKTHYQMFLYNVEKAIAARNRDTHTVNE
jgi:hypothetical protein